MRPRPDGDPGSLGTLQTDAYMGRSLAALAYQGKAGCTFGFDSTAVEGAYEGRAAPS